MFVLFIKFYTGKKNTIRNSAGGQEAEYLHWAFSLKDFIYNRGLRR